MVCGRAFGFSGVKGENVKEIEMPEGMKVLTLHHYSHLLPAAIGCAVDDEDNRTISNKHSSTVGGTKDV